ncbi:TIGR00730 family Rossman fold protein [Leptospira ilyithenensis]|uniref:Cytokinin riboside 5'-monophosphate phosphoribohydrolase n=1 Tax=Leptospira ilyithenensis TaxID=2484901 RepID=A0A4R9LP78_9LEPT|nr:TIGR00730 family Rossman fold protein [Leptospira ilyithenensis]TGN10575.1 TIGR00730 family Rossman fold protein [Leptospira ilyithenensis]
MKRIAVFCGSNFGTDSGFGDASDRLARIMVEKGIGLVYGGGSGGLMGRIADEVLRLGGEAIGVIPHKLVKKEIAHSHLTELIVVETMHERKAKMAELSDGFIAMAGGIGTLEEIVEAFTWSQLEYHDKPCAFLNTNGYYDTLLRFIDEMVLKGFLSFRQKEKLIVDTNPAVLLEKMLLSEKN